MVSQLEPSFGHEYKKVRPAIIIQDDKFIKLGRLLTVVPISSKVNNLKKLDILIKKDSKNRLMFDSLIKTMQISSFDKRRFIKLIGVINESVRKELRENINNFLGSF